MRTIAAFGHLAVAVLCALAYVTVYRKRMNVGDFTRPMQRLYYRRMYHAKLGLRAVDVSPQTAAQRRLFVWNWKLWHLKVRGHNGL